MRAVTYNVTVHLTAMEIEPCWNLLKAVAGTRCICVDAVLVRERHADSLSVVRWDLSIPLLEGRPRITRLKVSR